MAHSEGIPMFVLPSDEEANVKGSITTSHEIRDGKSPRSYENSKYGHDEAVLAKFGKKQQLKVIFQLGLTNGGPSGLVYGFIFAWIGSALQALVMGEMASMVAILSPPWCSKFLSYMTGWVTVIAYQACLASSAFLGGTMIQGLLVLNCPSYGYQRWHGTLLLYAFVSLALLVNTWLARLLPRFESLVLVIHVVGFFCILIPLTYLAPHVSAKEVFATFVDGGEWGSQGLSFMIGLSTGMFGFIGCDAASHMAEEIESADEVIPKSMIASVGINGLLGFGMVLAILFSMGNVDEVLASPTGFPFIQVFHDATGSNAGATAMTSIIVAAMLFATIASLATASRMLWAFAREKGIPGYTVLVQVRTKSALPIYCIALTAFISTLLALINIGSSAAFNALTSLVIAGFYTSFGISACVLLHKRLTTEMTYGPFHLGRAGIPIIIGSLIYSVIGVFFSFWPGAANPTPASMNWSVVVFFGTLSLSLIYWVVHGRHVYTGPILEIDPRR
ncbi:choline transport protein [Rutstroemia sp. NJR-2017a BBW]|nr:choline transport protein [Rutstroemia sp. NJR-2017a BBW]